MSTPSKKRKAPASPFSESISQRPKRGAASTSIAGSKSTPSFASSPLLPSPEQEADSARSSRANSRANSPATVSRAASKRGRLSVKAQRELDDFQRARDDDDDDTDDDDSDSDDNLRFKGQNNNKADDSDSDFDDISTGQAAAAAAAAAASQLKTKILSQSLPSLTASTIVTH